MKNIFKDLETILASKIADKKQEGMGLEFTAIHNGKPKKFTLAVVNDKRYNEQDLCYFCSDGEVYQTNIISGGGSSGIGLKLDQMTPVTKSVEIVKTFAIDNFNSFFSEVNSFEKTVSKYEDEFDKKKARKSLIIKKFHQKEIPLKADPKFHVRVNVTTMTAALEFSLIYDKNVFVTELKYGRTLTNLKCRNVIKKERPEVSISKEVMDEVLSETQTVIDSLNKEYKEFVENL